MTFATDVLVPEDPTTHFWSIASDCIPMGTCVLARRASAPSLQLASFVYAARPRDVRELEIDLDAARSQGIHRFVLERRTPAWVEAELRIRGWSSEDELRLELPRNAQLAGMPRPIEIVPAREIDATWSARGAMLRADHLEEDARRGDAPRPIEQSDAIVRHRQDLERHAPYLAAVRASALAGFLCTWVSRRGIGVIEDVYVEPNARGLGVATALLHEAVRSLRARGAGVVAIAAEIGDTPAHLYSRLGFRPHHVVRSCTPGSRA